MTLQPGRLRALLDRIGIAALIAAILTSLAAGLPVLNVLQGWISDAAVAARAAVYGAKPLNSRHVLVVGMDFRSLNSPELKSRPKAMFSPVYADFATKLYAHGAKGIILDVIMRFDAKDLTLDGDAPLKRYDDRFLKLLLSERKNGRFVLGRASGLQPARRLRLIAGPNGTGLVDVVFGTGSVIRFVPTRMPDKTGRIHPTLSGRALALQGVSAPPPAINIMPPASLSTLPTAALIDILRCDDSERLRQLVEGRVVFLGGMLPGEDRLKTPDLMIQRPEIEQINHDPANTSIACDFPRPPVRTASQPTVPGVFVHAAAVDAIMSGWQVLPAGKPAQLAMVFLAGFLATLAAFMLRPALAAASVTALIAAAFATAVTALEAGWFLPSSWAIAAAPIGFLGGYGLRIRLLDRRSNLIRQEFGRYLSPVLVEQMIESGQLPELGGEERDVTVVFADLSGFTSASERMESAALMAVLNRYLDTISVVIRDNGGYVDKFIGDSAMAIFNAPAPLEDHTHAALTAAHQILLEVNRMAADDDAAGRQSFGIKIGVSAGPATVGNVGSRDRVNYTVVGETVNLAARYESLPTLFRTPIVIGPEAAERVAGTYRLLRIAQVQVKGKTEGVAVFAPFEPKTVDAAGEVLIERYGEALAAFEAGKLACAAAIWDEVADTDWPGAGPAAAMAGEARRLGSTPLPDDWTGVLAALTK